MNLSQLSFTRSHWRRVLQLVWTSMCATEASSDGIAVERSRPRASERANERAHRRTASYHLPQDLERTSERASERVDERSHIICIYVVLWIRVKRMWKKLSTAINVLRLFSLIIIHPVPGNPTTGAVLGYTFPPRLSVADVRRRRASTFTWAPFLPHHYATPSWVVYLGE